MVGPHLELDEFGLACHAHYNALERLVRAFDQNRATVLRAPHDVVPAREHDVAVEAIGTVHKPSMQRAKS